MFHGSYRREAPLAVCPDLLCRRQRRCRAAPKARPCRRFFMEPDEWREAMADKLEKLYAEWSGLTLAEVRRLPRQQPTQQEMAKLKRALLERQRQLEGEALLAGSPGNPITINETLKPPS